MTLGSRTNSTRGTGTVTTVRILIVIGLALAVSAPFVLNRYWLYLASMYLAYVVALLGLKVLFGDAGQLSLGQASFMAIGAYSAGILVEDFRLTFPYELLAVIVISGLVAAVVALPALRVSGLRFALVTLAFGGVISWLLRELKDWTGGEQGIFVPSPNLYFIDGGSASTIYFLALVLTILISWFVWRIARLRIGRDMSAVRESMMAASSVGISSYRAKFVAFVIAGMLGGVSGLILGHVSGAVSPITFDLFASVYLIVGLILGGARFVSGAWLGAAYLVLVPAAFTTLGLERFYVLVSGLVLIVVLFAFPGGIAGSVAQSWAKWTKRKAGGESNVIDSA